MRILLQKRMPICVIDKMEFEEEHFMLIAIDHGNYAVKTEHDSFVSGLSEHSVQPPLAADVIEHGGRFWTLTGARIPYMRDKTRDERFFILTLFAVVRELRLAGELPPHADVDLAVGLPPEHFSVLKDKFAGYLRRDAVSFVSNGARVCLSFRRVFVYPQAYAAVVPQARSLISMPRVFVIDIGGYTTDVLLLRNGKPDLQFCRSLELGAITMANEVIGRVGSLHDMRIEDDHVMAVIQGMETILPEAAAGTILESARRHAGMILDKLRELQVDLRSNPAIFIGGGAMLFKPCIEGSPMVSKADFVPDPKANAVGYAMLAAGQLKSLGGGSVENA
jgi:plasmid segregation protein ParM